MTTGYLSILWLPLLLFSNVLGAQNIGVKTATPQAVLDVNGSVAMREGTPLSMANGTNNNVTIDTMSFYRITAPTAVFTITGFTNGLDGRLLTIINATSYTMTLKHQVTSSTANQINTGGSDVTVASNGVATFMYNATLTKWVLTGGQGLTGASGTGWSTTGNSGTTAGTNFVGTTDNKDLVFKTNNAEEMRITSAGSVGIGTSTPGTILEVNGGLSVTPGSVVNLTTNNQVVTVGNESFIILNNTGGSKFTFTITDGLTNGQILILLASSATNVVLIDSGNCNLDTNWNDKRSGDVMMLIWYGSSWYEISHSDNH